MKKNEGADVQLGVSSSPPPSPLSASSDHLLMVLQWSLAFCKNHDSSLPEDQCQPKYEDEILDKFYVHGLWPKPDFACPGTSFNRKELLNWLTLDGKIRNRLETNWPDAKSIGLKQASAIYQKNVKFWGHEWDKHGRCQTMTQNNYFKFVVDKYDGLAYIPVGIVQKFHPQPKKTVKVKVADVVQHVETNYKLHIDVSCNMDDKGNWMLFEIYFNLTLSGELKNITAGLVHSNACPTAGYVDFV